MISIFDMVCILLTSSRAPSHDHADELEENNDNDNHDNDRQSLAYQPFSGAQAAVLVGSSFSAESGVARG